MYAANKLVLSSQYVFNRSNIILCKIPDIVVCQKLEKCRYIETIQIMVKLQITELVVVKSGESWF